MKKNHLSLPSLYTVAHSESSEIHKILTGSFPVLTLLFSLWILLWSGNMKNWPADPVGPVQNIFFSYRTQFQFLCPHRPASWANRRVGPPVYKCLWSVYRANNQRALRRELWGTPGNCTWTDLLKVLPSEMDPLEIRLIRYIFIKGSVAAILEKSACPPSIESPLKHESASYFSTAIYAITLDSCGDFHFAHGPPLGIENRRNWGVFLTPLRNLQTRAAFIAPFTSEEW